MTHDTQRNTATNASRSLIGLASTAMIAVAIQLGGCAVAEKNHYVEHLTHVIEPAHEPDERVIAAFQQDQPGTSRPTMAAADDSSGE